MVCVHLHRATEMQASANNLAQKIHQIATATDELKKLFQKSQQVKEMGCARSIENRNEDEAEVEMISAKAFSLKEENKSQHFDKKALFPQSRVHPQPTQNTKQFSLSAVLVKTDSETSHIADLSSQSESLNQQYEDKLKQLYRAEWPDAVPEFSGKCHCCCCCCRDPERDKHSWEKLKQAFPTCIFYLLVLAGAIPHQKKSCFCLLNTFWITFFVLFVCGTIGFVSILLLDLRCFLDDNCFLTDGSRFEFSARITLILEAGVDAISIIFILTFVRDVLQSQELQTLLSVVGPRRVSRPICRW